MEFPKIIKDAAYHLRGYRDYLELAVEEQPVTGDYENWAEIAFYHRDNLEKMIGEMTEQQKEELNHADSFLREHQEVFANCYSILAELFYYKPPKSYWWWYLPTMHDQRT